MDFAFAETAAVESCWFVCVCWLDADLIFTYSGRRFVSMSATATVIGSPSQSQHQLNWGLLCTILRKYSLTSTRAGQRVCSYKVATLASKSAFLATAKL